MHSEHSPMASNFIPMLSSSPPPLDDCPDNEDDEEEFGTFTSANIAFDSSFDSPVAGEKYKSFIKTGKNGVNDIALKNDLNAFSSAPHNFTLSFSQQNQSSHKKSVTLNESEENDKFIPNSGIKILSDGSHNSSMEELNVRNKEQFETSQNCVPEVVNDSSCNSYKENDRSKRKLLSTSSNKNTFSYDESNSISSNLVGCDAEVSNSLFVPLSDELEIVKVSEDAYIPGGDIDNIFQSTDVDFSQSEETFSLVNSAECLEQSNNHKNKDLDAIEDSIRQEGSDSENLNAEFPASFSGSDNFDKFDDFQGVDSVNNTTIKSSVFFNKSIEEDADSFEAHFDDFQAFEDDSYSKVSEFADFKSSEKAEPSEVDEFADFERNGKEDHTGADEFTDFKRTGKEDHSDADEFDDFQSFDKARSVPFLKEEIEVETSEEPQKNFYSNHSHSIGQSPNQDDFEDFDDFQACPEVGAAVEQGFANFEVDPFKDKTETESPEFADFEGTSFSSASCETYPSSPCLSSSSHNQEKIVDKISTVINAIFPTQEQPDDVDFSYDPELEVVEQSIKSRRMWEKLHEAEQTPGLRFQWGVSHSFQQLLRSVNVDYHSILRTSSVPIFASGLSLLEPVKGQTSSANVESDDKIILSPRDPIPPVEFDWNSSGLVNPLDTGQSASMLMDLSFLSSSDTASSSVVAGDHSFENELLKPSPVPAFPENNNKTFILEELLSKNVCSIPNSNITHRPSDLSEEANSVLDQLPDLSYMRAKVLMFPISSKT